MFDFLWVLRFFFGLVLVLQNHALGFCLFRFEPTRCNLSGALGGFRLFTHTSTFSLLSPCFSPDIPSPHSSPLASPGQSVPSASAVLTVLVLIHGAGTIFSCLFIIFSSIRALVLLSHALSSLALFLTVSKTRQKDFRPRSSACFSHSSPSLALLPPFRKQSVLQAGEVSSLQSVSGCALC